jgi:hypothetical protein
MFGLPQVQSATNSQDEPVTLDDDPLAFEYLLSSMYKGV